MTPEQDPAALDTKLDEIAATERSRAPRSPHFGK